MSTSLLVAFSTLIHAQYELYGRREVWRQDFISREYRPRWEDRYENLGGYVDWHIDVNISQTFIDIDSIDIILTIFRVADPPLTINELINIYDLDSQEGRFYLSNFDQYIWPDGKIKFALTGTATGVPIFSIGSIGLLLSFEGLRVVQEIMPKEEVAERRTLIFVHGYSWVATPEDPANWLTFLFAQEFLEAYDDIIVISYYGQFKAIRYSKHANGLWTEHFIYRNEDIDQWWLIEDIAFVLAQYIIQDYANISDNVDFITHSMGGLVTRYMIKYYYDDIIIPNIPRAFKIKNVAMLAPPNHGGLWYWVDTQAGQMQAGSPFLNKLNAYESGMPAYSEIPLSGIDINWFTYRSGLNKGHLLNTTLRHDGMVDV